MLRNIITLAVRTLLRGRLYSVINVAGFALGIAAALALFLYVRYELTYDRMHPALDRLYRVQESVMWMGEETDLPWTPPAMAPALAAGMPEVEIAARYRNWGFGTTEVGERKLLENYSFADPEFFDLIDIPLLRRAGQEILSEPQTVAISETLAERYFPGQNPVGEQILFDDRIPLKVEAVFADPPPNTQFNDLACVMSLTTFFIDEIGGADEATNWFSHNYMTLVRLSEGISEAEFERRLEPFLLTAAGEEVREPFEAQVVPYAQLHLGGDYRNVTMIGLIGGFILLIACINYMNLSTARSLKRAREIGVRKVLGGTRGALIRQFMGEALLVALLSVGLALLLLELAFPWFEDLVGIPMRVALNLNLGQVMLALLALALGCGLLAGSYPSLVLSSFRPARVLKAGSNVRSGGAGMRKALVVFQFAISLALVFGTITVLAQHRHMLGRDLGFEEDGLIYATMRGEESRKFAPSFKQALLRSPRIESVSVHSQIIGRTTGGMWTISTPEMTGDDQEAVFTVFTDPDYVRTLGLNLVWGRDFDPQREEADRMQSFLVNEEFVRHFGIDVEKDPRVSLRHTGRDGQIVGVLEDYNFQPLQHENQPAIIALNRNLWDNSRVAIRVSPGPVDEAVAAIEATWKEFDPRLPLTYHFLDDWLEENYKAERRLGDLLTVFAGLAIVVASLGLLGLAAYATETRTKEIGIRKVMGASSQRIVLLLTRDFLAPVVLANLLAWPVIWWLMGRWLEEFPYRIGLPWQAYAVGAVAVAVLAWSVMAAITLRAANRNPVKSLRYE